LLAGIVRRRSIIGRRGLWRRDRKHLSRRRLDDRGLRCLRGYAEARRKVHLAFGRRGRFSRGIGFGRGGVRRRCRLYLQNGDGVAHIAARKKGKHGDADHQCPEYQASSDG
jgi:hypothetical protein